MTRHRKSRAQAARSAGPQVAAEVRAEADSARDYTADVLEFLHNVHGKVRCDAQGDYYYETVSAISLHFLLRTALPAKEVLWQWYRHFEEERGESIYQTLPPLQDEVLLTVLGRCDFRWDAGAVRASGLVFLPEHRNEVYVALDEFLSLRMEAYETLDDEALRKVLRPHNSWTDAHLRRLIRRIQTEPLSAAQRQVVYSQFTSDYQRATARHLLDQAQSEAFWKDPPPQLEALEARFISFAKTMADHARRLGVYVSRADFERRAWQDTRETWERMRPGAGARMFGNAHADTAARVEAGYFATLGLTPQASLNEVKTAYREKVKQHHPDQGGTVQDFLRLQEAYEYLLTQVF